MKIIIILIVLSLYIISSGANSELEQILQRCKMKYSNVNDYTAMLHKKELVEDRILEDRNIIFKFMKPQHFYMKWIEGDGEGTETLYVEGKYDNELVVHLGKFLGLFTITIDPFGKWAMENNRHPITEAGMGHIINIMEDNYKKAVNDSDSQIIIIGDTLVNNRTMYLVKTIFPLHKDYYGNIIYIYFDNENYLPVKFTVYGWKNELLEDYFFDNLKLNVGLTEEDFDEDNPNYGF